MIVSLEKTPTPDWDPFMYRSKSLQSCRDLIQSLPVVLLYYTGNWVSWTNKFSDNGAIYIPAAALLRPQKEEKDKCRGANVGYSAESTEY